MRDNPPPPLPRRAAEVVRTILSRPTPRTELMRWSLRLYCGHIVERSSHRRHLTVHDAFLADRAYEVCGISPATIVAAVPLGVAAY